MTVHLNLKKNPCVYITFDSDTTPYDIIVINGE